MPKQILDLQNKIFQSAKVILEKEGYDALSMRKVAGACSIAVGTVYNYVRGKDELVAQVIMEDWVAALERMAQTTKECVSVADGMCGIYQALMAVFAGGRFVKRHRLPPHDAAGADCRADSKRAGTVRGDES